MKNILTVFSLLFLTGVAFGQVQKVNYGIKYNPTTCLFDCYMKVMEGQTNNDRDRIQFNSQISVVVPTGSQVTLASSHAPFVDNIKASSTKVAPWTISNFNYAPVANEKIDIYGIVPKTYPVATYNDLKDGDEIILFSLSIYPIVDCAKDVRIFDINQDPSSSDKGMNGSDFRNGFTIGGVEQKFGAFDATVTPTNDFVQDFKIVYGKKTRVSYTLNNDLSDCQKDLSYTWKSPNGKVLGSSKEAPSSLFDNVQSNGKYTLEVKDVNGCVDLVEFSPISSNTQVNVNSGNGSIYGSSTGTNDFDASDLSVSIFPNPAKDFVNVSILAPRTGKNIIGSITDLSGKVVQLNVLNISGTGTEQNVRIPLNLVSGIYNLGLVSNNENLGTYKLIVVE